MEQMMRTSEVGSPLAPSFPFRRPGLLFASLWFRALPPGQASLIAVPVDGGLSLRGFLSRTLALSRQANPCGRSPGLISGKIGSFQTKDLQSWLHRANNVMGAPARRSIIAGRALGTPDEAEPESAGSQSIGNALCK